MRINSGDNNLIYKKLNTNDGLVNIKNEKINSVKPDNQNISSSQATASKITITENDQKPVIKNNAPKSADLQNISLGFNKSDTYGAIGKDMPIENLDVKKAVSDMQKDQALQQYHYFVGNPAGAQIFMSEDGKVVSK